MLSWCSVPRCSATALAASRSGESSSPTAKVLSFWPRSSYQRAAMAATRLESRPPERKTPTGTSLIICRFTVLIRRLWTSSRMASGMGAPGFEGLQYLLVVVHLAVADEVEALIRRRERLPAPLDVHDGEAPVAQGVAGDLDEAVVVGAAVGYAPHHAPHVFGFYAAVSANDSAHVSLRALISGRGTLQHTIGSIATCCNR